jgi:hypothetical protein
MVSASASQEWHLASKGRDHLDRCRGAGGGENRDRRGDTTYCIFFALDCQMPFVAQRAWGTCPQVAKADIRLKETDSLFDPEPT